MSTETSNPDGDWIEQAKEVWRWTLSLSWPVMIQQVFQTLMRTTDIIVTGLFSPVAVAAIGLADLYAQIPLRLGQGLGGAAIALSSQDTGAGADANRDEAVTQALIIGALIGVPLAVAGALFGSTAIDLLGAAPEVVRLGGLYLAVILVASPAKHVAIIGVRALQGTGDTKTPMLINIGSNVINIACSVVLGLGIGPFPRLGIFGVGLATALANAFTAASILLAFTTDRIGLSFRRPRDWTITRQLVVVGTPQFAEGMSSTVAMFPFNALLLGFGTEVVAAFHIGRRMRQQVTAPFYRSFSTASSVITGQTLGGDDPESARFNGLAVIALAFVLLGLSGGALIVGAAPLARVFTSDPATLAYAVDFARVFGLGGIFFGMFFVVAGCLRGSGETRIPFIARMVGAWVIMLGGTYLAGEVLDVGIVAVYAVLILSYLWMVSLATVWFFKGDWEARASTMMDERGTSDSDS
jgi:putative MATE family efflux protein